MPIYRVVFLVLILFAALPSMAKDTFVIATFAVNDDFNQIIRAIVKEAYNRAGFEVKYISAPGERALILADSGEVDGDIFRVAGIEGMYTNLRRVPEPVYGMRYSAFTKTADFTVEGWNSLMPYRVTFEIGAKLAEEKTLGMRVYKSVDAHESFRMLSLGETDVVIESYIGGQSIIRELNLSGIRSLAPPLEILDMYHYLHKRHEAFIPEFNQHILDIKTEGVDREIARRILGQ